MPVRSAVFAVLAIAAGAAGEPRMAVREPAIRADLDAQPPILELPVESSFPGTRSAELRLFVVDPDDGLLATDRRVVNVREGSSTLCLPLALEVLELEPRLRRNLAWARLHYRLDPGAGPDQVAEGLRALPLSSARMRLEVSTQEFVRRGDRLHAWARIRDAVTAQPLPGAQLAAWLEMEAPAAGDAAATVECARGRADRLGFLALDCDTPSDSSRWRGRIRFIATDGLRVAEASSTVPVYSWETSLLDTDRGDYLPGQTLHARAILRDVLTRPISDVMTRFEIRDAGGELKFSAQARSSPFGVASADWEIPEDATPGPYGVWIVRGEEEDTLVHTSVEIGRHTTPTLALSLTPDRSYYLPGQSARVELDAGAVPASSRQSLLLRLLHEGEPVASCWFGSSRPASASGAVRGEISGAGKLVVPVDLKRELDHIKDDPWLRYRDWALDAVLVNAQGVTLGTGSVVLRLSREPIHVYAFEGAFDNVAGLPVSFYVTSFYPDGSPARARVRIGSREVDTGAHGAARINLPWDSLARDQQDDDLEVVARDEQGHEGHTLAVRRFPGGEPAVRVETDRTRYAAGSAIELELTASEADLDLVIDLRQEWRVLESHFLTMTGRTARLSLPYREDWHGKLMIAVHPAGSTEHASSWGQRTVLFPEAPPLTLTMEQSGSEAAAGELALRVVRSDAGAPEAEIGIEVSRSLAPAAPAGAPDMLALERLERLVPGAGKADPELEHAAEAWLNRERWPAALTFDYQPAADAQKAPLGQVFGNLLAARLAAPLEALRSEVEQHGALPFDPVELGARIDAGGAPLGRLRDPWDQPFWVALRWQDNRLYAAIESAGPDELRGSADDAVAAEVSWPFFAHPEGDQLAHLVQEDYLRSGTVPASEHELERALRRGERTALLDPWGKPPELTLARPQPDQLRVTAMTTAPDGQRLRWSGDIDWFGGMAARLRAALAAWSVRSGGVPADEVAFDQAMRAAGIERERLRDTFGQRLRLVRRQPEAAEAPPAYSFGDADTPPAPPAADQGQGAWIEIALVSPGADGIPGNEDDRDVWLATGVEAGRGAPVPVAATLPGTGTPLSGVVRDPTGSMLGEVVVTAHGAGSATTTRTDSGGRFRFAGLEPGNWDLELRHEGYTGVRVRGIVLGSRPLESMDIVLSAGNRERSLTVLSETPPLSERTVSTIASALADLPATQAPARVRPLGAETVLWLPAESTGPGGILRIRFPELSQGAPLTLRAVASGRDGAIATLETALAGH